MKAETTTACAPQHSAEIFAEMRSSWGKKSAWRAIPAIFLPAKAVIHYFAAKCLG
jgi:hypothetical protein